MPAERRADHMLGIRSPRPLPPDLLDRLAAAQIYVSVRGQSVRVSPHVYNAPEDVYRFIEVLAEVL